MFITPKQHRTTLARGENSALKAIASTPKRKKFLLSRDGDLYVGLSTSNFSFGFKVLSAFTNRPFQKHKSPSTCYSRSSHIVFSTPHNSEMLPYNLFGKRPCQKHPVRNIFSKGSDVIWMKPIKSSKRISRRLIREQKTFLWCFHTHRLVPSCVPVRSRIVFSLFPSYSIPNRQYSATHPWTLHFKAKKCSKTLPEGVSSVIPYENRGGIFRCF